jgi:NTE family protein
MSALRQRDRPARRRRRVGVVLGAGGVLGGAWMAGAIAALHRETGFDAREADCLVGTSAGAVFAALLASGVSPTRLLPPTGARDEPDPHWILNELAVQASYRPDGWLPRAPLGSWRLAVAGLLQRPSPWSVLQTLSGIAPAGRVSAGPIERTIRQAGADAWPPHPDCRIVATDYGTGRRVVFGASGTPSASLAGVVAASCAIPGFFEPVLIDGRRYVDGGLHSMCNLDLLVGTDLDLVICFSAMTSHLRYEGSAPVERAVHSLLFLAGAQLDRQARMLEERGVNVIVVEPSAQDRAAMGTNMMDVRRCGAVLEVALTSTAAQLRRRRIGTNLGRLGTAA